MNESSFSANRFSSAFFVPNGKDCLDENHGLGISRIDFKVLSREDSHLLILENTFHDKGGPARHLHYDQDEWFYVIEGEFIFEIGDERVRLHPGDSLLGPRRIPHVWAFVGDQEGRILIVFTPAGQMKAFFRKVTKTNAMPIQDSEFWQSHGMELLGPPLKIG